jgi:hypothetical protein
MVSNPKLESSGSQLCRNMFDQAIKLGFAMRICFKSAAAFYLFSLDL